MDQTPVPAARETLRGSLAGGPSAPGSTALGSTALGSTALGTTALGRVQLRVLQDDGHEDVVVERRWPDPSAARAWCERSVLRASPGTEVLEIEVFGEAWQHPKSWETTKPHPVAQTLQIGVLTPAGSVRWAEPHLLSPHSGTRYLR